MRSWRLFGQFGQKVDPVFLVLLERSAGFTVEAADALVELFASDDISEASFRTLDDIEHRADANTHDLLLRLERGYLPPLPRETTRTIAVEIDEVVDSAEGAAELAVLSGVREATRIAKDMTVVLAKATRELASLTAYIGGGTGYRPYVARIHEREGEGDALWEESYRSLFTGEMEPLDVIRWKEIYALLEDVIDRCETTAKLIQRALGGE